MIYITKFFQWRHLWLWLGPQCPTVVLAGYRIHACLRRVGYSPAKVKSVLGFWVAERPRQYHRRPSPWRQQGGADREGRK